MWYGEKGVFPPRGRDLERGLCAFCGKSFNFLFKNGVFWFIFGAILSNSVSSWARLPSALSMATPVNLISVFFVSVCSLILR